MTASPEAAPLPCADAATARDEPLVATASSAGHWLLVEHSQPWPRKALDASELAGDVREHLEAQLTSLPDAKLCLVRRPGRPAPDRPHVLYGTTRASGSWLYSLRLDRYADLCELDLAAALRGEAPPPGEPHAAPALLVCTHGRRDACCARYGRLLCEELHARAPAGWLWQSSHLGGHRFAPNAVALPEGLFFGRLHGEAAGTMLSEYLAGRIALEGYRGRSFHPKPVQAAEERVRRETGLRGFHDLRLTQLREQGERRWIVDLLAEVAGDTYRVEVEEVPGSEAFISCDADGPEPTSRYDAAAMTRIPGGEAG
jgi:hypothetical protein